MAIDTPARVAVLGAGPIGLETALYARFLGYDVDVFERGEVAANVRQWGHVTLFTPFAMNHSPLGRSALAAQGTAGSIPADDALLTGRQWLDSYLQPLSEVDLLGDAIHVETEVISVGKEGFLKSEMVSYDDRFDELFQILARDRSGEERWYEADIVIDTTGTFGHPNFCGPGGMPAAGETNWRGQTAGKTFAVERPALSYALPDVDGSDHEQFANRNVLVVGRGFSAATNVQRLLRLRERAPGTSITWAVRGERPENDSIGYPISRYPNDTLTTRDELAVSVNQAVADGRVKLLSGAQLSRLTIREGASWWVEFAGELIEPQAFDAILANVGFRGDWTLSEELQLHRCYASGASMKWSAELLGQVGGDCLAAAPVVGQSLVTTEPNFYVLGAKSYGRWSNFLFQSGLDQIRQLFRVIADRDDLDLYGSPLPALGDERGR